MPSASLPALEQHLEARLLELERLHQARPGLPTAMARAEAGQADRRAAGRDRRDSALDRYGPGRNPGRRRGEAQAAWCLY